MLKPSHSEKMANGKLKKMANGKLKKWQIVSWWAEADLGLR